MRRVLCVCALVLWGCDPTVADTDTDGSGSTSTSAGTMTASSPTATSPATSSSMTSGNGMFDQTLACASWLDCLPASQLEELLPFYGPDGTCWTQTVAIVEGCDAECAAGFFEDCDGPPPMTTDDTSDTTTGPMPVECALDELAPRAESNVEAGDEEALIPAEIGELLERVCSCHVADVKAFPEDVPLYYGNVRFSTLTQMHSQFEGAPTYVEVGIRALDEQNMPPVYFCGDAEFGSLHTNEYEILEAWIEADAPDGAQWLEERPKDLPPLE